MGMVMSFMGKGGSASSQMVGFFMGTLYNQFVEKDITNFEEFHIAVLDIFNNFNSSLPGKHLDVPSRNKIEDCFKQWKEARGIKKKRIFVTFMKTNVNLSQLDDYTIVTGVVTPPVAMVAKRAGENVPQLNFMKSIPDVVFVPSATVLALVSVKLSRRIFLKNIASQE